MLKKFQIIWNCTTYRSKIVSRKQEKNDVNYKIVKTLFIELKNANPNGCNVALNNIHPMI